MMLDIRVNQQAKEQLIRIKRITGIKHWNSLCRWALCISVADASPVGNHKSSSEGGIEMTWKVFGGQWADVYEALLIQRCRQDGVPTDSESLSRQVRLHIHRGIGSMTADKALDSIAGLVRRPLL